MSERSFAIETRADGGLGVLRQLRLSGKIPGVLYGHGTAPKKITIDARALGEILQKESTHALLTLQIDGKRGETALLRELQRDPITRRVIHADLQLVSATEQIKSQVKIVTVGVPPGVKDFGGVLDLLAHTIELQAPANAMPEHVEVDVSALGLHDHIVAGDVKLPAGAKLLTPPEMMIVTVEPPRKAEEELVPQTDQATPEAVAKAPEPEA